MLKTPTGPLARVQQFEHWAGNPWCLKWPLDNYCPHVLISSYIFSTSLKPGPAQLILSIIPAVRPVPRCAVRQSATVKRRDPWDVLKAASVLLTATWTVRATALRKKTAHVLAMGSSMRQDHQSPMDAISGKVSQISFEIRLEFSFFKQRSYFKGHI